jgi:hypothetical protein
MDQMKCNNWEYEDHPDAATVTSRCSDLLAHLYDDPSSFNAFGYCTKVGHKYIFRGVAPKACKYLAGNYRGTMGCLKNYEVSAGKDSRVGYPSLVVAVSMASFETRLASSFAAYEKLLQNPTVEKNPPLQLVHFLTMVSDFLVLFLSIHPYANGNGHMARLGVLVLLRRYNFWPKNWPLDERPNYVSHIVEYRNGNKKPLIEFLLKCVGPQALPVAN